MTTDVEARLRAALLAGADAITDDATQVPPLGTEPLRRRPPRRPLSWSVAAAAAVIVLVAALAIGLRSHRGDAPSGRSGSVPSPAPSTSVDTGVKTGQALQSVACQVPLPAGWRSALAAGQVSGVLAARAVTPNGQVIAVSGGVHGRDLVLVKRDHSVRELYRAPATLPGQGAVWIGDAATDGTWVAFSLIVGGGQGARGGIEIVDLTGHNVRAARSTDLGTLPIVQPPVVLDGTVYWSETSSAGFGHVYAYDIAANSRRTVDTGRVSGPVVVGGGLFWTKGDSTVTYHRSAAWPAGYQLQIGKQYSALLHDGASYAWGASSNGRSSIEMSIDRSAAPVTVVASNGSGQLLTPLAVIGRLLVYRDDQHVRVLDTRTGASAVLASGGVGLTAARGGSLAIDPSDGRLTILQPADLPELRC